MKGQTVGTVDDDLGVYGLGAHVNFVSQRVKIGNDQDGRSRARVSRAAGQQVVFAVVGCHQIGRVAARQIVVGNIELREIGEVSKRRREVAAQIVAV